jgi:molecular chaperone DnaK (HSP70)
MKNSRYIVGIDLGTTNCAVSYIDTRSVSNEFEEPDVSILKIPQIVEPGNVQERDFIPSFMYLVTEAEMKGDAFTLPWSENGKEEFIVGIYAQKRGAEVPARLISSAKSWLCHPHVDRTASILPWKAHKSVKKKSPLEVSTCYLEHIRRVWNHTMAQNNEDFVLENQDVYLTVPASFDAVARDLTVKASVEARLPDITLLEEPQAAFYSWINHQKDKWRKQIKVGDIILVCDIGGGTTDFSLIEATEEDGELQLKRIAVGDHILLGGDNMDLTLAFTARQLFSEKGIKLDAQQMLGLIHNCRMAKEKILDDPECQSHPVVILGRGRSVVGGTIQADLERKKVEDTIIEGFFAQCTIDESPQTKKALGFKELGLHYESDTAITRHMSRFLKQHARKRADEDKKFIHPTHILFNGGVTRAASIRKRINDVINSWLESDNGHALSILEGENPDLAVCLGAAYYGLAKRGKGIRIRGGTARTYYLGIETSMPAVPGMPPPLKALCVVPFGMEEGTDTAIPGQEFGLVVGEHAIFRFLGSTTRKKDTPGIILDEWDEEEIEELAPLETKLEAAEENKDAGTVVPVRLHSYVTEIGTLELWCESTENEKKWKLEFNVREEE